MLDDTQRRTYSEAESRARVAHPRRVRHSVAQRRRSIRRRSTLSGSWRRLGGDYASRGTLQIIDTYRQSKDYATALKEADAAIKKFPDERIVQGGARHGPGRIRARSTRARRSCARCSKGDRDRETHLALAQIYEKAKRYADMGKALDEAEKLSKTNEDKEDHLLHARRDV